MTPDFIVSGRSTDTSLHPMHRAQVCDVTLGHPDDNDRPQGEIRDRWIKKITLCASCAASSFIALRQRRAAVGDDSPASQ